MASQIASNNNSWDLDSMLAQEIENLNRDTAEDRRVKEAVLFSKPDPNQINPDDSCSDSDQDEYEEDLFIRDPELFKITESNRQIPHEDNNTTIPIESLSNNAKQKPIRRPLELVFSDPPILVSNDDCIEVTFSYGESDEQREKKSYKTRKYMIMCNLEEESKYAMKWAIGTLLRSGDEIHVVGVIEVEEDVKNMDSDEKYKVWRKLDNHSKDMISYVKTTIDAMLLYNIKIVTYSLAGKKPRESLLNLIYATSNLTMIICGARELSAFKGMLMGSVSTYLVHNSPVPVSVVRPQKKEKKSKKTATAAQKLSQSVKNGHLKVDEAEGAPLSINSYDGTSN